MRTLSFVVFSLFVAAAAPACSKSNSTDCTALFEKTKSLVPENMRDKVEAKKDESIARCEKMSPEARQCAADATSMEDLAKCPHK
jgi:hypothetical protein